jgi:hypothetical protein
MTAVQKRTDSPMKIRVSRFCSLGLSIFELLNDDCQNQETGKNYDTAVGDIPGGPSLPEEESQYRYLLESRGMGAEKGTEPAGIDPVDNTQGAEHPVDDVAESAADHSGQEPSLDTGKVLAADHIESEQNQEYQGTYGQKQNPEYIRQIGTGRKNSPFVANMDQLEKSVECGKSHAVEGDFGHDQCLGYLVSDNQDTGQNERQKVLFIDGSLHGSINSLPNGIKDRSEYL